MSFGCVFPYRVRLQTPRPPTASPGRAFLLGLRGLEDLRLLSETLTFHDEYTGYWTFDAGARNHADLLRRLSQKLVRRAMVLEPYPHNYGTWVDVEE